MKLLYLIKKIYMISCNKIYGINNRNIAFISFGGKSYSDNPRAISEKLHQMNPQLNIIWLFQDPQSKKDRVPSYVTCAKSNTFKSLKIYATSKVWIDNFAKPIYFYKSKKQVYIQTWHGDRGFKKILYDAWLDGNRPSPLIENKICDLVISGSQYGENKLRTAFKYEGNILKQGCPRNDALINIDKDKVAKLKEKFNLANDTYVLLYAPTLRRSAVMEGSLQSVNDIDIKGLLSILEKKTNGKWICFIRAHSSVKGLRGIEIDGIQILDGNSFEDMKDLLLISDVLITDYSSSAGDFALLKRLVILYQPDRDDYIRDDRTFYFDINKSPYRTASNNEELVTLVEGITTKEIEKNCEDILTFYGTYETGMASNAVVNYIISKIS